MTILLEFSVKPISHQHTRRRKLPITNSHKLVADCRTDEVIFNLTSAVCCWWTLCRWVVFVVKYWNIPIMENWTWNVTGNLWKESLRNWQFLHQLATILGPGNACSNYAPLERTALRTRAWQTKKQRQKHHIFAPRAGARCTIFPKLCMVIELVEVIKKVPFIFRSNV